MSELLNNLNTKYLNKVFLLDDYDKEGVIWTNYKVSVVKKWLALFRSSKYCTITHNPPKKVIIDYKGKDVAVKNLLKDVNISEEDKKRLTFFPEYVTVKNERKFNLDLFVIYLNKRNKDFFFLTRDEYEKELPLQRKKPFKVKKRKWD